MIATAITYTPNYPGATPVSRKHYFATEAEKTDFLNRMHRLYPDTKEI
jgi:predicted metal-dependent hydrolase